MGLLERHATRSGGDAYEPLRLRVKEIERRVAAINSGNVPTAPSPRISDDYFATAILDLLSRLQHAELQIAELNDRLNAGALK